jgi:hypothetical protein
LYWPLKKSIHTKSTTAASATDKYVGAALGYDAATVYSVTNASHSSTIDKNTTTAGCYYASMKTFITGMYVPGIANTYDTKAVYLNISTGAHIVSGWPTLMTTAYGSF